MFPRREPPRAQPGAKSPPDFAAIHEQLRSHRHVTLQLLWEEYRQANPDGYRYSPLLRAVPALAPKLDVVLRQEHKAGEKTVRRLGRRDDPDLRPRTGVAWQAPLFVAVLGASSYT